MTTIGNVTKALRTSVFLLSGTLFSITQAEADCKWTAHWRNNSTKSERTFQLTAEKGAQFGIETDFLCIVSPVGLMSASSEGGQPPIKHVDMNCRYAEGERGMATGLAGIEADFAMEVVHFFLTDQVGDTSHSVTLKLMCESMGAAEGKDSDIQGAPSISETKNK